MPVAVPDDNGAGPRPSAEAWALAARLTAPGLGLVGPVLWEPSCRLVAGTLIEDRFLLSLPPPAPGASAGLRRVLGGLGIPALYLPVIEANLPDAVHLHLGVERGGAGRLEDGSRGLLYKFYLEFTRTRPAPGCGAPPLLYLACKWDPQRPQRHALTRYFDCPATDAAELARRLAVLCGGGAAAVAAAAMALVARADGVLPAAELPVLTVLEEGNPRSSFDLCLYDAGLRLGDLGDWLGALWGHFGLAPAGLAALLAHSGNAALGHFAGGLGRDGAEFCTIYYGVGRLVPATTAPPGGG